MRAPEPASFWRDRRHSTTSFSKNLSGRNKLSNARSFIILC